MFAYIHIMHVMLKQSIPQEPLPLPSVVSQNVGARLTAVGTTYFGQRTVRNEAGTYLQVLCTKVVFTLLGENAIKSPTRLWSLWTTIQDKICQDRAKGAIMTCFRGDWQLPNWTSGLLNGVEFISGTRKLGNSLWLVRLWTLGEPITVLLLYQYKTTCSLRTHPCIHRWM